jgi:hypothetical protein
MPGLRPGEHPERRGRAGRPDDAGPITIRRTKELAMTTVDGLITSRELGAAGRPVFASVAEERLRPPKHIDAGTALQVREQIGHHLAGWFQFRPLWDQIIASDPDLFG